MQWKILRAIKAIINLMDPFSATKREATAGRDEILETQKTIMAFSFYDSFCLSPRSPCNELYKMFQTEIRSFYVRSSSVDDNVALLPTQFIFFRIIILGI